MTDHRVGAAGRDLAVPQDVQLEDQDGRRLTFGSFFTGRPSVVAFFYTRCDNPNKCSLTITKLAALQRALHQQGWDGRVGTSAITYDPAYDLPPRLRAYGQNRGVAFGDGDRFLRATAGLEALQEYFDLGVNFGQASVNRHRIELFILTCLITQTIRRYPSGSVWIDDPCNLSRPDPTEPTSSTQNTRLRI